MAVEAAGGWGGHQDGDAPIAQRPQHGCTVEQRSHARDGVDDGNGGVRRLELGDAPLEVCSTPGAPPLSQGDADQVPRRTAARQGY